MPLPDSIDLAEVGETLFCSGTDAKAESGTSK
jgi:hypothetical protein